MNASAHDPHEPQEADTSADDAPQHIDPARSACVLIGVDAYTELAPLRSVRRNLSELREALESKRIWGIPSSRITAVSNPQSASDLVGPIREAAKLAKDTLIVYYAGHGLLDRDEKDRLYLTLPDSVENQPDTAVSDDYVRRAMRDYGSAERRVLLLDCCYSGRIIKGEMSVADRGARASGETLRGVKGAYVMTSTSSDRKSLAPDPKRCSAFTQEFVGVLRDGVPDGPQMLGLSAIFEAVRQRMAALELPLPLEPRARGDEGVGLLPFVRNLAVAPPPRVNVPGGAPSLPPSRGRRWALLAGTFALGVAAGFGVPKLQDVQQELNPRQAGGACSKRATLLSYSDDLNKQQVSDERIGGLSALALTGDAQAGGAQKAMALTDNEIGRLFPLRLGEPEELEPEPDRATTLRSNSGGKPSEWFDGEGLVLEQGGNTALVASETGPVIRRFDLTTGKQIGEPLDMPREFKAAPDGDAPSGHTIESLTVSQNGKYLYAGMEGPLARDGDTRGRNLLRIQRYRGTPGGEYKPDGQYAYRSSTGMYLAELTAVGNDRLLALERQFVEGLGNAIRVYSVPLAGARQVDDKKSLYDEPADTFLRTSLLFDLAECPAGDPGVVPDSPPQRNPLHQNVEGMALGEPWPNGEHKGKRPLYLLADDNNSAKQITRVYALSVRL
jgi:hypothetical protein